MQIRVLYVSRAVGPVTTTVTASILATAQSYNQGHGITGVLCQGDGLFLQVLEGERSAVNQLYARIMVDRRHKDVELLLLEEITQRRFGNWSMAHVSLSDIDPATKIEWPEFDPYSITGLLVMARIDDLLAEGSVIQSQKP